MPDETVAEFPYDCMEMESAGWNATRLHCRVSRAEFERKFRRILQPIQARDSKFRRVTCVRTFLSRTFWLSFSLSLSSSSSRSFNFSLSLSILACTSIRVTVCDWSAEPFVRKTDDSRLKEATWSPEMELSRAPASERSWLRFRALLLLTQRVNFPGRERCTKKRCNCLLWLGIPNENFFQYALNVFRHRHLMTIFARFLREFDTFSFRYFRVNSNAVTKLSSRDTFV